MGSGFLRRTTFFAILFGWYLLFPVSSFAKVRSFADFEARPPIHIKSSSLAAPSGLNPSQIKSAYNLPDSGGKGTIAIIGAYDDKSTEKDLNIFSKEFNLPSCTASNGCLEIHKMSKQISSNEGWAGETSLDTQWSHAIAPKAKILLVEAKTAGGKDLLSAVDYARDRNDVVSISMSWGGGEFNSEKSLESHFTSKFGAAFFASSGDNGAGVEWPAVSLNVIGVGGTTLHFNSTGKLTSESAWSGSGGGISSYLTEPTFQVGLNISGLGKKRAVPDVSYNADPESGFAIYHNGWSVVGGTSAGAPQWAAMRALGKNISLNKLYTDAKSHYPNYFRDISKGVNGDCGRDCSAGRRYDLVTGLGSPLTALF